MSHLALEGNLGAPPAADAASGAITTAREAIEWEVNPWRQDPRRALLTLLSVVVLWVLLIPLRLSPLMTAVLGIMIAAYFQPGMGMVRCRVDEQGVARRRLWAWERRDWPAIRRARIGAWGLFVSPYASPHRLDGFRGLFLPLPQDPPERRRLEGELRQRMTEHGL
jgi:hypothetical protein